MHLDRRNDGRASVRGILRYLDDPKPGWNIEDANVIGVAQSTVAKNHRPVPGVFSRRGCPSLLRRQLSDGTNRIPVLNGASDRENCQLSSTRSIPRMSVGLNEKSEVLGGSRRGEELAVSSAGLEIKMFRAVRPWNREAAD